MTGSTGQGRTITDIRSNQMAHVLRLHVDSEFLTLDVHSLFETILQDIFKTFARCPVIADLYHSLVRAMQLHSRSFHQQRVRVAAVGKSSACGFQGKVFHATCNRRFPPLVLLVRRSRSGSKEGFRTMGLSFLEMILEPHLADEG